MAKSLDLDVISEFCFYCFTIAFNNSPVKRINSGVLDLVMVSIFILEEGLVVVLSGRK